MTPLRNIFALAGLGLAACASGTAAPGQAPTTAPAQAQAARVLADEVLVLPVHEVTIEGALGVSVTGSDTVAALRTAFDAELRRALEPHVTGTWMWPEDVRAVHRRNPLNVPDPARLATRDLRGSRLAAEQIVGQDLGSQIRTLLAVAGARRYVLLPLRLHAAEARTGGHVGGVTLLVIDTRRSMILQVIPVQVREGVPAADVIRAVAELARLELAGPDPQ